MLVEPDGRRGSHSSRRSSSEVIVSQKAKTATARTIFVVFDFMNANSEPRNQLPSAPSLSFPRQRHLVDLSRKVIRTFFCQARPGSNRGEGIETYCGHSYRWDQPRGRSGAATPLIFLPAAAWARSVSPDLFSHPFGSSYRPSWRFGRDTDRLLRRIRTLALPPSGLAQ